MSKIDHNIILLKGANGVGKTTIANRLSQRFNFKRLSFANVPKIRLSKLKGYNLEDWNNREFKEEHRKELINYAENMKLEQGEDVWARYVYQEIIESINNNNNNQTNNNNFIIDDLRFDIEYETISELKDRFNILVVELENNPFVITPNSVLWLTRKRLTLTINSEDQLDVNIVDKEIDMIMTGLDRVCCE